MPNILFIILGMAMLIKASDVMIDGASSLARRFKISELIIAITIVSFGTSAPELLISLSSAVKGYSDIALGNVVGSNMFNLLGILGIIGLIMPIISGGILMRNNILFLILASTLLIALPNTGIFGQAGTLGRGDGAVMLAVFAWFFFYICKNSKPEKTNAPPTQIKPLYNSALRIILGLAALIAGAEIVVHSAVALANALDIGEDIIAITIVAIGTSLPELTVSFVAALKKKNDIAVGNIISSNIFNILFVLGLGSLVRPITYSPEFNADILLLIFGSAVLLWTMYASRQKKLTRPVSALFIMLYLCYLIYVIAR